MSIKIGIAAQIVNWKFLKQNKLIISDWVRIIYIKGVIIYWKNKWFIIKNDGLYKQ
jgi:hypothetical protein